jgi:ATP-dependent DNA helicase RecQ
MKEVKNNIIFCDIEGSITKKTINEIGFIYKNIELNTTSISEAKEFIKKNNSKYISGHNFINFDLKILENTSVYSHIQEYQVIDTLPLSLLLFNEKTLHSLPKNYKTEDEFKNNPVEDSKLTAILLEKIIKQFVSLNQNTQNIFYSLLKDDKYFKGFFYYLNQNHDFRFLEYKELKKLIYDIHKSVITNKSYLFDIVKSNPVELAYILAILTPNIEIKSHPPKILYTYPNLADIQKKLCFDFKLAKGELSDFSKEVFGFGTFREFPRLNAGLFNTSISQKEIVEAALKDESFLTILPTGGGKTFTFWLPSIIKSKAYKSLTVVISPLQALIEDHIKSFNSKVANYKAVAISGFQSPLERQEAIEQTINGEADILYIAPESLRSNSIFNILKNRLIERFVIDEAHCLSTWGNDFRQDYFYICEYVKDLLKEKNFQNHIPISCFTATAKPSVIKDIKDYFLKGLDIKLGEHFAIPERKNLQYKSIPSNKKNKFNELLKLINEHEGSTLVYIPSSTKDCDDVANLLTERTNKRVCSFHSKLDSQDKMKILKEYIEDEIDIIVATTAFGMGVDKSNITNVIHYEISESLENYAQEAGRGARDENLNAFCPILYDEDDMDKHFNSLNRSKLTSNEINSIFRVLNLNKKNDLVKTAFELAKEAGWDVEDNSTDYSTKVKTALLELEREGYIKRDRNKTKFFADSIASQSWEKLHLALEKSDLTQSDKDFLVLVHNRIIGNGKIGSIQIDELAYQLTSDKSRIAFAIQKLKEMEVLGDNQDLTLNIYKNSIVKFKEIKKIELALFKYLNTMITDKVMIRELNEYLFREQIISKNKVALIKDIIKNWRDKFSFTFKRRNREKDIWSFEFKDKKSVENIINLRHEISDKIIHHFWDKSKFIENNIHEEKFSLKELYEELDKNVDIKQIDKTLLYLHHLNIIELLSGRFINYSPMMIHKTDKFEGKRKYTKAEYKNRLENHYETKIESIHIMAEYAKRLQEDNYKAIMFLKDYFMLSSNEFRKQYKLLKEKITRPISQKRYNKIFMEMSDEQKKIIRDTKTKAMMILAGPGSGKTKVLVHKIASIILTEDIKPEQFMMLTFSKTAKMEFKTRLNELIGALSYDVEIQTFHSYALNLIARDIKGDETVLENSIKEATRQILENEVILPYKTVLVLDEFQDINEDSFELVKAIYSKTQKEMRIIAVGDDDQCIMNHIGAKVEFIDKFEKEFGKTDEDKISYKKYELLCNFRSKRDIVEYSNNFIANIKNRYKEHHLYSNSSTSGKVTIQVCNSNNLILPTLELIKKEKNIKNLAVLAYTNEEVMQLYSMLKEQELNVRFMIDREGFSLKNIIELVEFDKVLNAYLVEEETSYKEIYFDNAISIIETRFQKSSNLKLLKKIVDKFLQESENFYISNWVTYLEEIKLEDFEYFGNSIVVSTIHKSKGMEFDKIILVNNTKFNNDKKISLDDKMRLYYVGMTRAKNELTIIKNGTEIKKDFDFIDYKLDKNIYEQKTLNYTHIMSLSDVSLGFDSNLFKRHILFFSGEKVVFEKRDKFNTLCIVYQNKILGALSSQLNNKILEKLNSGYIFKDIYIEYIVNWYDSEEKKYLKHPLCKIVMEKMINEH